MRLFRYARGSEWTVYLYCQGDDTCQVLDVLLNAGDLGTRMLADLRKVSTRPLASLQRDREFSKPIAGTKLLEFRLQTSRGATPRVAYFFDSGRIIVCALALLKKTDKLPQSFIDDAENIRQRYIAAGGAKMAQIDIYDESN